MSYEVKLTKTAQKIYAKLPPKLQAGLDRCFTHLEADPWGNPNVKRLKGYLGNYRYQVGGWRILYEVEETHKVVTVRDKAKRGCLLTRSLVRCRAGTARHTNCSIANFPVQEARTGETPVPLFSYKYRPRKVGGAHPTLMRCHTARA